MARSVKIPYHDLMRTCLIALSAVLIGAATPRLARAGDPLPGRLPGLKLPSRLSRAPARIEVGTWVEYSLRDRVLRRRVRIRWALVARAAHGFWWEVSFRQSHTPPLHIKVLSKGSVARPDRLRRVIVQSGSARPLELPLKQGQRIMDMYARPGASTPVRRLGTVTLTTPAGRFVTTRQRWTDAAGQTLEEWTSPTARLFGLVRFRSPRFEMLLIRQGAHARSNIRGTPARWRIPGL